MAGIELGQIVIGFDSLTNLLTAALEGSLPEFSLE
jgi:hypothetical protein